MVCHFKLFVLNCFGGWFVIVHCFFACVVCYGCFLQLLLWLCRLFAGWDVCGCVSLVFRRGVVYLLCCLVAIGLVVWMALVLWVIYCCGCLVHVDYGCGRLSCWLC